MIVGLVKPVIFKRIIKRIPKRKTILLVCSGIMVVSFIGIGIFAKPVEKNTNVEVSNIEKVVEPQKTEEAANSAISDQTSKTEPVINNSQIAQPQSLITSNQNLVKCKIVNYLPDSDCTPGATDPRVTQNNISSTICVSGYTKTVRPSTSVTSKIKTERMQAYGYTDSPSNYELDHFISLELGGSPDSVLNLFPEPYAEPYGAYSKDKVENYLHKQVCNGAITLAVAQEEIKTNWVKVYNNCCTATKTTQPTQTPSSSTTSISTPQPIQQNGHTFYLSSYRTAKYYYCDTDDGWKGLTPEYLKSYPSEQALLKDYPSRTLHEACK